MSMIMETVSEGVILIFHFMLKGKTCSKLARDVGKSYCTIYEIVNTF